MGDKTSNALPSRTDIDDLRDVRISKRSYIFNIRRRFEYIRDFKTNKKLEGLALFKKLVRAQLKSLSKFDTPRPKKIPRSPGVPKGILLGLSFLLISIIIIVAYFVLSLGALPPLIIAPELPGSSLSLAGGHADVAGYGQERDHTHIGVGSVFLSSENVSRVNLSLSIYPSPVIRNVVLVRTPTADWGDFEETFSSELDRLLKEDSSSLATIHLDQLNRIPASPGIYVILSDHIPASLLGAEEGADLLSITKDGAIVIFAGFQPTDAISERGDIIQIEGSSLGSKYGLSFRDTPAGDFEGLNARSPLYSASGPSGSFLVNGQILVATFSGKGSAGSLLLIPQTLSGGWGHNASAAAQDFFNLIRRAVWLKPLAQGSSILNSSQASGTSSLITKPTNEISGASVYPYFVAEVSDISNRSYLRTLSLPPGSESTKGGNLYHNPSALPFSLTGERLAIKGANLSLIQTDMDIRIYSNDALVSTVPIGQHLSRFQYSYAVDLAPGNYILKLYDIRKGELYAKSYLRVPELSVGAAYYDWTSGSFSFRLLADRAPITANVDVSELAASINGRKASSISFENKLLVITSDTAPFREGIHSFEFDFGTSTYTLNARYAPRRNWWDQLEYQLIILTIGIVFFIGYVLKRPDIEQYSLDVPDFPPLSKISVPVKKQAIVDLFNSVNQEYKWKYMPLKISEIKSGFRKVFHKGKGILIGDYNTERILDRLTQEGTVKKVLGMHALTSWEQESGRSARYLAIFRKMRDVLINNAIMFEDINSSKDYDTKINLGQMGSVVHIHDPSPSFISHILANSGWQRQILLFANDAEKVEFEEMLDSTSKACMLVKMLISAGRLSLINVDELESHIKLVS